MPGKSKSLITKNSLNKYTEKYICSMNFYITKESDRSLKNIFSNLSAYYIINVDMILSELDLDLTKPSYTYLVNNEIERLIITGAKSKRFSGIIYINSKLDKDIVLNIKSIVNGVPNSYVDDILLLDDYDLPKLKPLYKFFDEVIFFPTIKKTKVINFSSKK